MDDLDGQKIKQMALEDAQSAHHAFEQMWRSFYPRMLCFARTFSGLSDEDREETATEAVVQAFRSIGRYDADRPLAAWVYGVARHVFEESRRKHARTARRLVAGNLDQFESPDAQGDADCQYSQAGDPAEQTILNAEAEACRLAIQRLPDRDRQIAMLRFYEDLDASQIGKVLKMPASSVRWRIAAIRESVRTAVEGGNEKY